MGGRNRLFGLLTARERRAAASRCCAGSRVVSLAASAVSMSASKVAKTVLRLEASFGALPGPWSTDPTISALKRGHAPSRYATPSRSLRAKSMSLKLCGTNSRASNAIGIRNNATIAGILFLMEIAQDSIVNFVERQRDGQTCHDLEQFT